MNTRGARPSDVDRSLAIFYHPLFQEVTTRWASVLLRRSRVVTASAASETYPTLPKDFKIKFLDFMEFNLRVQKSLLPSFDITNAFVSGLNDWVKEITECFHYRDLYSNSQLLGDEIAYLHKEIEEAPVEWLSLKKSEYVQLIAQFSEHEAFRIARVQITSEVFSKFLFDLCTTWCEHLDIELFVFFLFSVFLQISQGDNSIDSSILKCTKEISNLKLPFFQQFEQQKEGYLQNSKRKLRYYRAWCEWNYLRINEMGESMILRLASVFPDDEERVLDLVSLFERVIDVVNKEISEQIAAKKASISSAASSNGNGESELKEQMKSLIQSQHEKVVAEKNSLISQQIEGKDITDVQYDGRRVRVLSSVSSTQSAMNRMEELKRVVIPVSIRDKKDDLKVSPQVVKNSSRQIEQLALRLSPLSQKARAKQQLSIASHHQTIHTKLQQQLQRIREYMQASDQLDEHGRVKVEQMDFEVDRDVEGRLVIRRVVKMPVFGKHLNPVPFNYENRRSLLDKSFTAATLGQDVLKYRYDPRCFIQLSNEKEKRGSQDEVEEKEKDKIKKLRENDEEKKKVLFSFAGQKPLRLKKNQRVKSARQVEEDSQTSINLSFMDVRIVSSSKQQKQQHQQQQQLQQEELQVNSQQMSNETHHRFGVGEVVDSRLQQLIAAAYNPLLIEVEEEQLFQQNTFKEEGCDEEGQDQDKEEKGQRSVLVPEFLKGEIVGLNSNDVKERKSLAWKEEVVVVAPSALESRQFREKIAKQYNQGQDRICEKIIDQSYKINVLPRYLRAKVKQGGEPIARQFGQQAPPPKQLQRGRRFYSRDYSYEIMAEKELVQVREKSLFGGKQQVQEKDVEEDWVSEFGGGGVEKTNSNYNNRLSQPQIDPVYRRAVERYRAVWKKYLSEDEMYMLNDWDSLYKIIILLKKKFSADTRKSYLSFLSLDLVKAAGQTYIEKKNEDDVSTQAGESDADTSRVYIPDKEKFKKDIERLLKRDERRKIRRANRRKAQDREPSSEGGGKRLGISGGTVNGMKRFKSRENRALFKDVFINALLPSIKGTK